MYTRRHLSVLALFFISLAPAALSELRAAQQRTADIELPLARSGDVYLVVAVDSRSVSIRARGVTLETIGAASVRTVEPRHWWRRGRSSLSLPHAFTVAGTVTLLDRQIVAPRVLEPWTDESEPRSVPISEDSLPIPPPFYEIPLDGGWKLEIGQENEQTSTASRFTTAVSAGWSRLTGGAEADPRPTLYIELDAAAAQTVYHLFRKGTVVLVTTQTVDYAKAAAPSL